MAVNLGTTLSLILVTFLTLFLLNAAIAPLIKLDFPDERQWYRRLPSILILPSFSSLLRYLLLLTIITTYELATPTLTRRLRLPHGQTSPLLCK